MNQFTDPPKLSEGNIEEKRRAYIALAQELSEAHERIPFPGINPESYSELRVVAEEFPEYTTPIDELIEKFRVQGMKVMLSESDPKNGSVHILPFDSENVEMDNLFPRHLLITQDMDEKLKKLILANIALQS